MKDIRKRSAEEVWNKNMEDLNRYNKFAWLYALLGITGTFVSMYFGFIWGAMICIGTLVGLTGGFVSCWRLFLLDRETFEKEYKEVSDIVDDVLDIFSKRR